MCDLFILFIIYLFILNQVLSMNQIVNTLFKMIH